MHNLQTTLQQLREEREKLDSAIVALEGLVGRDNTASIAHSAGGRVVSAAARARMAAAQRARRLRERGEGRPPAATGKSNAGRKGRTISAAGRRRIAEAARKRWAKLRAKSKKSA